MATALALVWSGCASGPAPQDHFYRLETPAPGEPLPSPLLAGTLEVRRFRAEAVTAGREILYRASEHTLEVQRHSYQLWVEPPPSMLQAQLASYLRAAKVAQRVVTPELRVAPDYQLSGRLLRLERVLGENPPRVIIEVELGLTRTAGHELLLLETYRDERESIDAGVASAAVAFSEALGSILTRFLDDLGNL